MRIPLALFALVSTCAFAQTPLVKILSDELDRNFTVLKQKGDPAPYFMSYEVTSTDSYALVASRGSLETKQHNQARYLDVTIRDGSAKSSITITWWRMKIVRVSPWRTPIDVGGTMPPPSVNRVAGNRPRVSRRLSQRFIRSEGR